MPIAFVLLNGSSLRVQIFGGRFVGTCFLEQYFLFLSQAFRYMSHKFHGKASGKMKSEKRNKKHQEEMVSYDMSLHQHRTLNLPKKCNCHLVIPCCRLKAMRNKAWPSSLSDSVHSTPEKFENSALFLRLGLPDSYSPH